MDIEMSKDVDAAVKLPISPTREEMGGCAAFIVTAETAADIPAREALLDRAMGPRRRKKSSEKLRRGRRPSEGLAFVARDEAGTVVGTVRLWDVAVKRPISPLVGEMGGSPEGGAVLPASPLVNTADQGGRRSMLPPSALPGISPTRGEIGSLEASALLLGPLAVDPALKSAGIGSALMRHALAEAARLGHRTIVLVGDAPYYARFGFSADKTGKLSMPGPYERHRLLALELVEGALDGVHGTLRATGRRLKQQPARLRAAA